MDDSNMEDFVVGTNQNDSNMEDPIVGTNMDDSNMEDPVMGTDMNDSNMEDPVEGTSSDPSPNVTATPSNPTIVVSDDEPPYEPPDKFVSDENASYEPEENFYIPEFEESIHVEPEEEEQHDEDEEEEEQDEDEEEEEQDEDEEEEEQDEDEEEEEEDEAEEYVGSEGSSALSEESDADDPNLMGFLTGSFGQLQPPQFGSDRSYPFISPVRTSAPFPENWTEAQKAAARSPNSPYNTIINSQRSFPLGWSAAQINAANSPTSPYYVPPGTPITSATPKLPEPNIFAPLAMPKSTIPPNIPGLSTQTSSSYPPLYAPEASFYIDPALLQASPPPNPHTPQASSNDSSTAQISSKDTSTPRTTSKDSSNQASSTQNPPTSQVPFTGSSTSQVSSTKGSSSAPQQPITATPKPEGGATSRLFPDINKRPDEKPASSFDDENRPHNWKRPEGRPAPLKPVSRLEKFGHLRQQANFGQTSAPIGGPSPAVTRPAIACVLCNKLTDQIRAELEPRIRVEESARIRSEIEPQLKEHLAGLIEVERGQQMADLVDENSELKEEKDNLKRQNLKLESEKEQLDLNHTAHLMEQSLEFHAEVDEIVKQLKEANTIDEKAELLAKLKVVQKLSKNPPLTQETLQQRAQQLADAQLGAIHEATVQKHKQELENTHQKYINRITQIQQESNDKLAQVQQESEAKLNSQIKQLQQDNDQLRQMQQQSQNQHNDPIQKDQQVEAKYAELRQAEAQFNEQLRRAETDLEERLMVNEAQFHQQLLECREHYEKELEQKNEELRQKDELLRQKDEQFTTQLNIMIGELEEKIKAQLWEVFRVEMEEHHKGEEARIRDEYEQRLAQREKEIRDECEKGLARPEKEIRDEYEQGFARREKEIRDGYEQELARREKESRDGYEQELARREKESRDGYEQELARREKESRDGYEQELAQREKKNQDESRAQREKETQDEYEQRLAQQEKEIRDEFEQRLAQREKEIRDEFEQRLAQREKETRDEYEQRLAQGEKEIREELEQRTIAECEAQIRGQVEQRIRHEAEEAARAQLQASYQQSMEDQPSEMRSQFEHQKLTDLSVQEVEEPCRTDISHIQEKHQAEIVAMRQSHDAELATVKADYEERLSAQKEALERSIAAEVKQTFSKKYDEDRIKLVETVRAESRDGYANRLNAERQQPGKTDGRDAGLEKGGKTDGRDADPMVLNGLRELEEKNKLLQSDLEAERGSIQRASEELALFAKKEREVATLLDSSESARLNLEAALQATNEILQKTKNEASVKDARIQSLENRVLLVLQDYNEACTEAEAANQAAARELHARKEAEATVKSLEEANEGLLQTNNELASKLRAREPGTIQETLDFVVQEKAGLEADWKKFAAEKERFEDRAGSQRQEIRQALAELATAKAKLAHASSAKETATRSLEALRQAQAGFLADILRLKREKAALAEAVEAGKERHLGVPRWLLAVCFLLVSSASFFFCGLSVFCLLGLAVEREAQQWLGGNDLPRAAILPSGSWGVGELWRR
jgi:hypothetical protein